MKRFTVAILALTLWGCVSNPIPMLNENSAKDMTCEQAKTKLRKAINRLTPLSDINYTRRIEIAKYLRYEACGG